MAAVLRVGGSEAFRAAAHHWRPQLNTVLHQTRENFNSHGSKLRRGSDKGKVFEPGKDGSQSHSWNAPSCKSRSVFIFIFITSTAEHLAAGAAALRGGAVAPKSSNVLHSSGSDSLHQHQLGIYFLHIFSTYFLNCSLLHHLADMSHII